MVLERPRSELLTDPDWCERAYNPRVSVPDVGEITAQWGRLAQETRSRLPYEADVRYGGNPREVLDIFRAPSPKGTFVFIHGGYWRVFSKTEFSWVADALAPAGYTVALINYPLCPEVTVLEIAECCRRAMATLWGKLEARERANVVISGHSAGGYLTGSSFATDWTALGLPATPFTGGLSISGVFELDPLVHTSMNELIRFTPETARATSIEQAPARVKAPLVLAVGGLETPEFHRQSQQQAAHWADLPSTVASIPGRHHFDVIEELRIEGSPLLTSALRLLGAREA
ncbi:MAG: alpha/beta hydrolase [Hyphomicrobiales bacterium]|nr:MAG: alpha/beta hydrolase [Hyphomicrobiales bacterium]